MKGIFRHITFLAVLLILSGGLVSCEDKERDHPCMVRIRPENLPTIDWKNYNSVYSVFRNYSGIIDWNPWMYEDTGKTVKVYGWMSHYFGALSNHADFSLAGTMTNGSTPLEFVPVSIGGNCGVVDSIMTKLATADPTKKIFVRGKLTLLGVVLVSGGSPHYCGGSWAIPKIRIYNANDIYFE